jgi:hypothetical protein
VCKFGIQKTYDDGEYLQNILLKKFKPNINNFYNFKSWHVFLSWHVVKNLQFATRKKYVKNMLHDDAAC